MLFNFSLAKAQIIGCKTVVIDAGHGGKDPGCHGKDSQEKEVALGIALALGKKIEENFKDVKVIYTRDTDVFVELDERARIANDNNADLFICIHANSAGSPNAKGADSHVLGLHRTEAQKEIARRENAVVELESNPKKYDDITPDKLIARTMQLSVYLSQSIIFASNIQKEFKKLGRVDRGVKQAGFVVLYKTTMPSVLIESGFLTNESDEAFLNKVENQEKMGGAIFNAFKIYKEERDKVAKAIEDNNGNPVEVKEEKGEVEFKIQLASSGKKIETQAYNFKGLTNVECKKVDSYYRYFYGHTGSYDKIKESLKVAQSKGYKDAFILAFSEGNRISLKKAINLVEE
jgi:N-acetylmuramoyl-L-alanine amidase